MMTTTSREWSEIIRVSTPHGGCFVELTSSHMTMVSGQFEQFLQGLSVGEGDTILIVGRGDDSSQLRPVAQAANALSCSYIASDLPRFVRPNLLEFFRQFDLAAVLGLIPPVVSAIQDQGVELSELFGNAQLYASEDSIGLMQPGSEARRWLSVGHLLAAECFQEGRLHLFNGAWAVGNDSDGRLVLSSHDQTLATGLRGQTLDEACRCGLAAPQIQLIRSEEG